MKNAPLFLLAVLFFACKNEPKQQATDTPAQATLSKDVFVVTVNDLRLRAEPNSTSNVLTQLQEGSVVEWLGEVSGNKEEVELRGRRYYEPYYLVMAPSKQKGWLYGGGMLRVYSGDGSATPDAAALQQFSGKLAALDVKKVESGKAAFDLAQSAFASANVPTADAGSLMLEHFLKRMLFEGELYRYTENEKWMEGNLMEKVYDKTFDMNTFPETKQLAEGGFLLATSEGMVYPEVNYRRLMDAFSGKLSALLSAYYAQNAKETENPVWDDGGLIIPLPEIADRAAWWEKFNRENPQFVQREAAQFNETWMIQTLTHGGDNTPAFDYQNETVVPEFREVWKYVREKYPDTRLAAYCGRMEKVCEAAGWKSTPEVTAEMEKISKELLPD